MTPSEMRERVSNAEYVELVAYYATQQLQQQQRQLQAIHARG